MTWLDHVGEFIALRDTAKEAARLASINDGEGLKDAWQKLAYNFERLDTIVRPGLYLDRFRPQQVKESPPSTEPARSIKGFGV